MKYTIRLACAVVAFAAVTIPVHAQMKYSWTTHCATTPIFQTVPASEHGGVQIQVALGPIETCSVTGSMGATPIKESEYANYNELVGNQVRIWGVKVMTLATGDKVYAIYGGVRNISQTTYTQTYQITGGTGKMQGIKGSGVCTSTNAADMSATSSCTGSYTLP
ncbi:MAG: hypothetical protein WBF06_14625 [Candidatus Acidiferrales bacterium]